MRIHSTKSKKAKARRLIEPDMMSAFENMDVKLGNGEYKPIESEIDQTTDFSNTLDRDDNEDIGSERGSSSQEKEVRNMTVIRDNQNFSRVDNFDRRIEPEDLTRDKSFDKQVKFSD